MDNFKTFNQDCKITNLCSLRTLHNIYALLGGSDTGNIVVYNQKGCVKYDSLNCHLGEVIKIVASPAGRYVFSCGTDGVLLIYAVTEFIDGVKMLGNPKYHVCIDIVNHIEKRV